MSLSICKRHFQAIVGRVDEVIKTSSCEEELAMVLTDLDRQFNKYVELIEQQEPKLNDAVCEEFSRFEAMHHTNRLILTREISRIRESSGTNRSTADSQLAEFLSEQKCVLEALANRNTASTQHETGIRLPKLSIPKFSGSYKQWLSFRDLFETTVIANTSLNDVQRFSYLKTLIVGQAASMISTIPLEAANFEIAWGIMKRRFDKPYMIVQSLITDVSRLKVSPEPSQLNKVTNILIETWQSMKSLGEYAQTPDPWVISLFVEKVDTETRRAWAEESATNSKPTVSDFLRFLEERGAAEELFDSSNLCKKNQSSKSTTARVNVSKFGNCFYCHEMHGIYKCPSFKALSVDQREYFISKESRCANCFSGNHATSECSSKYSCSHCKNKHNTLLHKNKNSDKGSCSSIFQDLSPTSNIQVFSGVGNYSSMFLPTAIIRLRNSFNQFVQCRALLDSGSQANLMSEAFFRRLGFRREYSCLPITSLTSSGSIYSKGKTRCKIFSNHDTYSLDVTAHILSNVMSNLPNETVPVRSISDIKNEFVLADPRFNIPAPIDMILGASVFFSLIRSKRFLAPDDNLFLQETRLGYVVCSKEDDCSGEISLNNLSVSSNDLFLDQAIERFWKLEEPSIQSRPLSAEEKECEKIYLETTIRLTDGRFSVRLPFKSPCSSFDHSCHIAERRFYALERKLSSDAVLLEEYRKFMSDYESLGHMKKIDFGSFEFKRGDYYIIPHHPIWQRGVSGRKLRVVFDASSKDESGASLNDRLHSGPALQLDISHVLINFRKHKYVMTADIEKMYRQIMVAEEDQRFQMIFWRESPKGSLQLFKLTTVTYGESCSPYLAIKTLQELARQDGAQFPLAQSVLLNSCYVDDLFFGSNSLSGLRDIQRELIALLGRGGFSLKKWASNSLEVLSSIPHNEWSNPKMYESSDDNSIKTLGVRWSPKGDFFSFCHLPLEMKHWTKRNLLSEAARIYDPCGWLSPTTVMLKLLFQQTWVRQLDWDSPVPLSILSQWRRLRDDLSVFSSLEIPRYIVDQKYEVHGFSDASKDAYGAVLYIRQLLSDGRYKVNLLMSKSRVAPIKQVSIPRLELCAAHLLARCISGLSGVIDIRPENTYLWSDSSTVLSWIKSMPRKWTPFVGNRVSQIHELCPRIRWNYIASKLNPADLVSRGLLPSRLKREIVWWNGPEFLATSFNFPSTNEEFMTNDEASPKVFVAISELPFWSQYVERFSSFSRMIRSLCYIFRVRDIIRKGTPLSFSLSANEVRDATDFLIGQVQGISYASEIELLRLGKPVSVRSSVRTLNPFLDSKNLLRVGGRLNNVIDPLYNPNPIILPKGHFARLYVHKLHIETYHGGLRLLCSLIRRTFWIPAARQLINSIIHACSRCKRYQATSYDPPMGQLPVSRITPSKPFLTTGVDFAGPLNLRPAKLRGNLTVKAYIAVFVCFSTKAIHLELIMSLSTNSLIQGIRRFIARRGRCSKFVSDNGRNFVGCASTIREFYRKIHDCAQSVDVRGFLSSQIIDWQFIPGYTPHFGGLWESGVRSVKRHLFRSLNHTILTIEEMNTALCQIESILNSRPLCPVTFAESDMDPITPAHLLMGEPIAAFPHDLIRDDERLDVRSRYEAVQNLVRGFWKRWRDDYLDSIIRKPKWDRSSRTPCIGDIVLIKRDFDPPHQWTMGKIDSLYRGPDDHVRVVDVLTQKGKSRECVRHLVPLKVTA